MNVTIRLNKEEKEVLDSVVGLYGGKMSMMIKNLVFEKLEEDFDLKIIKNFEEKEKNGDIELISLENIKKELEIE